jgi:hypothetical protein
MRWETEYGRLEIDSEDESEAKNIYLWWHRQDACQVIKEPDVSYN